MWYDKYPGVPKRGSPLETLFVLIHVARRDAELLATSSMVRAQFALLTRSSETAKSAIEAFQNYADTMMPFLDKARNTSVDDHRRLLDHVRSPMRIDMQSIRHERQQVARQKGIDKFRLLKGTKP